MSQMQLFVINCTLSFIILMNLSFASTCSLRLVMLRLMSVQERNIIVCSYFICCTLKLPLLYTFSTCLIDVANSCCSCIFFSSAVPKCIPHDTVTTNGISLIYIMSASEVTFRVPLTFPLVGLCYSDHQTCLSACCLKCAMSFLTSKKNSPFLESLNTWVVSLCTKNLG